MVRALGFWFLCMGLLHLPGSQGTRQSKKRNPDSALMPGAAVPRIPGQFELADGTPVTLGLVHDLSSADAAIGDRVDFEVLLDVEVNEIVVIPRGAPAWGTVTEMRHRGRMARGGRLKVKIDAVRLGDGEIVPLRAVEKAKGEGHSGVMKGELEQTSLTFFPAAPLALMTSGEDVTIPRGADITAYVNGDTALDFQRFERQVWEEQESRTSNEVTDLASLCLVQIRSIPDGAEIVVDKRFMGSTPSVIRLAPGDHKIQLNKSGFKTWERTVTLTPRGSEFINPSLEAE